MKPWSKFIGLAEFLKLDFIHVVCMCYIWVMLGFGAVSVGVVFCLVLCV